MDHRLVLMRHAKSDYPENTPDVERPLAPRGRRDAPRIGAWLRNSDYVPDFVLCSTAVRARQTCELVTAEFPAPPPVKYESRVYEASTLGLLMLVRELAEDLETVLVTGHNPSVSQLAAGLSEKAGMPPFPTAGVAVLEIPGPWTTASPGEARLLEYIAPREL